MKNLTCGDGKLDFFEQCDKLNNPSCSATCTTLSTGPTAYMVQPAVDGYTSPACSNNVNVAQFVLKAGTQPLVVNKLVFSNSLLQYPLGSIASSLRLVE